jgi:hypothetical protein
MLSHEFEQGDINRRQPSFEIRHFVLETCSRHSNFLSVRGIRHEHRGLRLLPDARTMSVSIEAESGAWAGSVHSKQIRLLQVLARFLQGQNLLDVFEGVRPISVHGAKRFLDFAGTNIIA